MSDFEIVQVSDDEPRTWATKDGKAMLSYEVEFSGDKGAGFADINKLATSKPPIVGETYDELVPANGPGRKATLKKVWKEQSPAQTTLSAAKGEGEFRSKEQIMRSYAHGQALQWVAIKVQLGKLEGLEWVDYLRYVDQFYEDVKGAA